MNYIYNERSPEGPDAMNFMVETCVDGLFQLGCDFNLWIFEDDLIVEEKGGLCYRDVAHFRPLH
ncbi:MAG: hypothetical protein OTI34_10540 [Lewinella sp.]|nr:hypothetical protein [Lewinella sp.]